MNTYLKLIGPNWVVLMHWWSLYTGLYGSDKSVIALFKQAELSNHIDI
jgi:hypothetical protein